MQENWSLDELYLGFDDPKFASDEELLSSLISQLNELPSKLTEDTADNVRKILKLREQLVTVMSSLQEFCFLRQAVNTQDAQSASKIGVLFQKVNKATKANTELDEYLASIDDIDELISNNPDLKEFEYLLKTNKEDAKYMLSKDVEQALGLMDISGGQAWSDLQSNLTSTLKVDYNGNTTTLSAIRNLAYDSSQEVRKAAYEAEISSYEAIKDAVAFSLNSIKMQANSECLLRGYNSILDKTLYTSRMKKETLDALFTAIDKYLPEFHRYLKVKAKALGHQNGLPWYDLFAPLGANDKTYSIEEAQEYILELFNSFNPELAKIAKRAFDENWIDYLPKAGKVGGAFCAPVSHIKQFRILTNFDGSFSDCVTLAHELGHGYHDFMVHDGSPLNQDYSMPVAETASTFNENVLNNAAINKSTTDEEKIALIESQLSDATQVICDIYSRFLFEKEVCERRANEFLSADELCDIMIRAQKKAYGDGLDHSCLHPYMWLCKGHYYSSHLGFYNFPYAFGGLFAKGLYEKYKVEKDEFIPKFNLMLKSTPLMSVEDVAKICDIDLTQTTFWEMSLNAICKNVDTLEKLLNK